MTTARLRFRVRSGCTKVGCFPVAWNLTEGGTAWFEHIGGFIAGMALSGILGTRRRVYRRPGVSW